jgi:hypothetical protein
MELTSDELRLVRFLLANYERDLRYAIVDVVNDPAIYEATEDEMRDAYGVCKEALKKVQYVV